VVDNVSDSLSDYVQSRLQGLGVFSGSAEVDDMVAEAVSTLRPVMSASWIPWLSVLLPDVATEFALRERDARLVAEAEARMVAEAEARRVAKEEAWAEAYLSGKIDAPELAMRYGSTGSEEDVGREVSIASRRASEEMEVEIETVVSRVDDRKGKAKAVVADDGPRDPLHLPEGSFIVSTDLSSDIFS
jgi:hypothetical protein